MWGTYYGTYYTVQSSPSGSCHDQRSSKPRRRSSSCCPVHRPSSSPNNSSHEIMCLKIGSQSGIRGDSPVSQWSRGGQEPTNKFRPATNDSRSTRSVSLIGDYHPHGAIPNPLQRFSDVGHRVGGPSHLKDFEDLIHQSQHRNFFPSLVYE